MFISKYDAMFARSFSIGPVDDITLQSAKCSSTQSHIYIQLWTFAYIRLLNKTYNKTEDPSVQAAGSDYKCYHYPIRLQMLELPCLKKSKES